MDIGGKAKNYERQKKSITEQLKKADYTLIDVAEIGTSDNKSALTSTLKGLAGRGKLSPDYWQIFSVEKSGRKEAYIQPYSGVTILPGEHHTYIKASVLESISLQDTAIFGGPVWSSSNDAYAKQLNKNVPALKNATKEVKFEWPIGTGKITLDWTVQGYSVGSGLTKVEMKTGRYGGLTTYGVGFDVFDNIITALIPAGETHSTNRQIPMHESTYSDLADNFLDVVKPNEASNVEVEEVTSDNVSDATMEKNYAEIIQKTLEPLRDKQIFTNNIPDKKLKNIREYILPDDFKDHDIIAGFDTTLFRSFKTGVIFTKTHCFYLMDENKGGFPLESFVTLKSLNADKDGNITVVLKDREVILPSDMHDKEMIQLLSALL